MLQPWFNEARFGLFIHWGIYAIPACSEWYRYGVTDEAEYDKLAQQFNPVGYDPEEWAEIAWQAGMRYVVFTTKHHDGFCLFDSKYTDFKITNSPYGQDATRMLVEAFRARGFRIGLYHSIVDWHHPHYVPDKLHPLGKDGQTDFPDRDPKIYSKYLYDSVEQLMTEYGKIDLLFWDFTSEWKTPQDWDADRMLAMIYRLQPEIMLNDRMSFDRKSYTGDYRTPEVAVPNVPPRQYGIQTPWETCATINGYWGYCPGDGSTYSLPTLTSGLAGCVAKGGNLVLNVGPDAQGKFPPESVKVLHELSEWFKYGEESIRGCGAAGFRAPDGYYYTQKGHNLYIHIPCPPLGDLLLPELHHRIASATLLRTGQALVLREDWGLEHSPAGETRLGIGLDIRPGDVIRLELTY